MQRQQVYVFSRPLVFYGGSVALSAVLTLGGLAILAGAIPIRGVAPVGFAVILAGLVCALSVVWRRSAFKLLVAADRIEFRQGVFSREEHVIMTDRVAGVDMLQTFADRSIGIGTVVIGSTGMDAVRCVGISSPGRAREMILRMHVSRTAG